MDENKCRVYIRTDETGRVLCCEGGYTMGNIADVSDWTLIDEGTGDRYNLCQSHYLEGGLYTFDDIPRYAYGNGAVRLRTDAEIDADRAALPEPGPTETERLRADVDFIMAMEGLL